MTTDHKRIALVCGTCGSDHVSRDALVQWDVANQRWELRGLLDNSDCNRCDGETRLVAVELASGS
jgi:hypothetical protein